MIPVEQRDFYDPDTGGVGDCWKCCIASILELTYDEVPHFVKDEHEGRTASFWNATQEFLLRKRGMVLATFNLWGTDVPHLKWGNREIEYHFHAPGHWIASVLSPRFTEGDQPGAHTVVMNGSKIVWDPHPKRDLGHLGFTEAYLLVSA